MRPSASRPQPARRLRPWVDVIGPLDGRPALVIPGLPDPFLQDPRVATIDPPTGVFAEWRVAAVALGGLVTAGMTTVHLADAVARVVDDLRDRGELGTTPLLVSGHSLGALVAMHLTARRPDLVGAVVYSSGAAVAGRSLGAALEKWARLVRRGDMRALHVAVSDVSWTGHWRELARSLDHSARTAPIDEESVRRFLLLADAGRSHDARAGLPTTTAPTLVIGGVQDPLVPVRALHQLAQLIPDSEVHLIRGGGHGAVEQFGAQYHDAIAGFVSRRFPAAASAGTP